jgi:hypothetical protein
MTRVSFGKAGIAYNGQRIEVKNLVIEVFGVKIKVTAQIEVFAIRKRIEDE